MNKDHIFIEVDYHNGKLDSVACVRTDRKGKVLQTFEDRISGDWSKDGITRCLKEAIVLPFQDESIVVTSLLSNRLVVSPVLQDVRWLAIEQVAWPLEFCDMIGDVSLKGLSKSFGFEDSRTVTDRCSLLVRVYWTMMRRYKTALLVEEVGRDLGGETLATVRRMFNF